MENRICDLPDDLLLQIMLFVPTKDAVATTILSKRWRFISAMLPKLEYKDSGSGTIGRFIEKSLQLHKAPKLERLAVELGPHSPHVDVDVEKCIENAVNRGVHELDLNLLWNAEITRFPKSLYTCDTLVDLALSNKILVDVPSQASLPSLLYLSLFNVVYKDKDSLARLLSSSSVLKWLTVERREDDNLTNFTVKVSSLKTLCYYTSAWPMDEPVEEGDDDDDDDLIGSLVIDTHALTNICFINSCEDCCLIDNMSCLDVACIICVHYPDNMFMKSLSSVKHLHLCLTNSMVDCCNNTKFSRLIEFYFLTKTVDWLEPLMFFLQNSSKMKRLTIHSESPSPPWKQPSSIPECLSSHLEIFVWNNYEGVDDEKQLVSYILANSKCLKTAEIHLIATSNLEDRQKEIQYMPRISTSSRLLFPTQMNQWFNGYCC